MVTKIWRECKPKQLKVDHNRPHVFTQSQWQSQSGVNTYYYGYKWVNALMFLVMLVFSVGNIGRKVPEGIDSGVYYGKWFIYLTHWGLVLCCAQAWMSVWMMSHKRKKEQMPGYQERLLGKLSTLYKWYWIINVMSITLAIGITLVYWGTIFNPAEHRVDAINVMVHALNTVLMLVDLCLAGHPVRFMHFYWPVCFAWIYLVFSAIYFVSGGLARNGRVYIYGILNWELPGRTMLIILGGTFFVVGLHSIVYGIFRLRRFLYWRFYAPTQNNNIQNDSIASLPTESVDLIV